MSERVIISKKSIKVNRPLTHARFVEFIVALGDTFPDEKVEPARFFEGGVSFFDKNGNERRSVRMFFTNYIVVRDDWREQFMILPDRVLRHALPDVFLQFRADTGYAWTSEMIRQVESIATEFMS